MVSWGVRNGELNLGDDPHGFLQQMKQTPCRYIEHGRPGHANMYDLLYNRLYGGMRASLDLRCELIGKDDEGLFYFKLEKQGKGGIITRFQQCLDHLYALYHSPGILTFRCPEFDPEFKALVTADRKEADDDADDDASDSAKRQETVHWRAPSRRRLW